MFAKNTFYFKMALLLALMIFGATPARAQQAPTGECNGEGAMQGQFSLTPTSGLAGSAALLSGSTQLYPAATQESTTVNAWWMETGNEQHLGAMSLSIDPDTLIGTFSGNITVPGNATPGAHPVAYMLPGDTDPACLTFTVTQGGGQPTEDAPPTVSRLPETGISASLAAALALAFLSLGLFSKALRGRS